MTAQELYNYLNAKIPPCLSCEWDNDGLMCCPNRDAEVKKVLVALDVTGRVVDEAIAGGYDVVLSHHPLIFTPLKRLDGADPVSAKVIRLLCAGISVMSFHTRLDAVEGGVNDTLAARLGLLEISAFGQDGEAIGRIGTLPTPMSLAEFAEAVKTATGAPCVELSDAGLAVSRVAILGGSGSDDVLAAKEAGADTYLSGELKHNFLTDAPDLCINLVAAGHFYTEDPVCQTLCRWLRELDSTLTVAVTDSNPTRFA